MARPEEQWTAENTTSGHRISKFKRQNATARRAALRTSDRLPTWIASMSDRWTTLLLMMKEAAAHARRSEANPLEIRERVLAEAERLRAKLPALLPIHAGRWIVFRDGEVASVHATEEEAYVAGIKRFGHHGGHVVAVVREPEIVPVSALTTLGL